MKKFISVLDMSNYKYLRYNLNQNIKLTKEAVRFNYLYTENDNKKNKFLYLQSASHLDLYLPKSNMNYFLPEGFVLAQATESDGIFIFKLNKLYKILIKRNGQILNQFVKKTITQKEISLLSFEYNLDFYIYDDKQYKELFDQGLNNIPYNLIIKLWNIKSVFKFDATVIPSLVSKPFLAASVLLAVFTYYENIDTNDKYIKLQEKYKQLKQKNTPLKNTLNNQREKNNTFNKLSDALFLSDKSEIFISIIKILKPLDDTTLNYLQFNSNIFDIAVDTSNSSKILEKLTKVKHLEKIKIISNIPIKDSELQRIRLKGEIK